MTCAHCGREIALGARFCGNCGAQGSDPAATTVVLPPEDSDALLARLRLVFAGDYDVERELGRGGMAAVFKATEVPLKRTVALKVLLPELGLTATAAERFKREASLVAGLDHPNVVQVYRVGQVGGIFYIAMRFVQGRSLHSILEAQGALPVPAILAILRGATRGLAFAHQRGVVHRDVKGGNILVDADGRISISDFGVALRAADVSVTAAGTVIGTPHFMSPEQCAGHRARPQSDQYSIGILAYQMLVGALPFESETLAGLMQHHFYTPIPDIHLARDDVPPALVLLLQRALAKDPDDRFDSTREMLEALEAIPFSEGDRRESERVLCDLAAGAPVPKLTTRSLPAVAAAHTLPLGAPAMRPSRWRSPSPAWIGGGVVAAIALTLGLAVRAARTGQEGRQPVMTTRPLRATAPAAPTGKLRLLTVPPVAEILVDGRRVGVGSVFDLKLAPGERRLEIRAPGYQAFDTTITVTVGQTLSLGRIALTSRDGARP